ILRPPIVYGPKDDGFSTIAQWIKRGIMISPQNIDARFSFIFVDDLVRCIIKSFDKSLDGEVFYVCEKNNYSWNEFIEKMAESIGVKKPKILKMPKLLLNITALSYEIFSYILNSKPVLNRDKVREAISSHWIADPSKWEEKTKMKNWTDLSCGLHTTFAQNSNR
ncbi:MAG: NAD-dependent epimerase/dehydratase family protein, partial [Elusimicrobiales bacterium]